MERCHTMYSLQWRSWRQALDESGLPIDPRSEECIRGLTMPTFDEWSYREGFHILDYAKTELPLFQAGRLIMAEGGLWNETTPLQLLSFWAAQKQQCEGKCIIASQLHVWQDWGCGMVCLMPIMGGGHRIEFINASWRIKHAGYILARHHLSPI